MSRRGKRAGWYADPAVPARFRFWDGEGWTRWLASSPKAPWPTERDAGAVAPVEDRADSIVRAVKWAVAAVVAFVLVATVVGVVLNRRDARDQMAWNTAVSPAPTRPERGFTELEVAGTKAHIFGGAVATDLPSHWEIGDPNPADGLFSEVVFAVKPKTAVDGGLDAFLGVGVVAGVPLVQTREQKAAAMARLTAIRLFGKQPGVSYGTVTTEDDPTYGPDHPGARASITVSWKGGSTVVVSRLYMVQQGQWFGWIASDGPEVSAATRSEREASWTSTTLRDS